MNFKRKYHNHYEHCKNVFNEKTKHNNVYDLTINENIETCDRYNSLVGSLRLNVLEAFTNPANYNVDDFRNEIKDPTIFPQIKEIHDCLYDQISRNFFFSHYTSNRVQIYKNIQTDARMHNSWVWHWDDNPKPQIKLFIYLSNVTSEKNGAFCYAVDNLNNTKKMPSSRIRVDEASKPIFRRSRIPKDFIDENNLTGKHVLGPIGKCFLFDPNIIHKATVPQKGHAERIALIYHYHPCSSKMNLFNCYGSTVKSYVLR